MLWLLQVKDLAVAAAAPVRQRFLEIKGLESLKPGNFWAGEISGSFMEEETAHLIAAEVDAAAAAIARVLVLICRDGIFLVG